MREAGHEVLVVGPSFYAEVGFGGSNPVADWLRRLLPGALGELAELAYNVVAVRALVRAWRTFRSDLVYERYSLFHLAGTWLARRYGATALLFDPDSPGAMWAAVRHLAGDPALRARLGQAARATALERHTWLGNARRVIALAAGDGVSFRLTG